jgi:hypothetical protein
MELNLKNKKGTLSTFLIISKQELKEPILETAFKFHPKVQAGLKK